MASESNDNNEPSNVVSLFGRPKKDRVQANSVSLRLNPTDESFKIVWGNGETLEFAEGAARQVYDYLHSRFRIIDRAKQQAEMDADLRNGQILLGRLWTKWRTDGDASPDEIASLDRLISAKPWIWHRLTEREKGRVRNLRQRARIDGAIS